MKQAMISYIQNVKNDEIYTPTEAILPILKYLDKSKIYWECTDFGNSQITNVLKNNGFKVVGTGKDKIDFLKNRPNFKFDAIITNPPYSIKNDFLNRAYEIGKPFAMLLPIHSLEGVFRGKLFKENGLELIVLNRSIKFYGKGSWFNTSWFCWKVCKKQLNFEEVDK